MEGRDFLCPPFFYPFQDTLSFSQPFLILLRWNDVPVLLDCSNPYNIVGSRFRRERKSAFPTKWWVLGLVSPDRILGQRKRHLMSQESGNYYLKCVSPKLIF